MKKNFTFTASTKSGLKLEIFYSADDKGGILIGARNTKTGYEHADCASISTVQGVDVIRLSNEHINQNLIGAKVRGVIKIDNFNQSEYDNAVQECKYAAEYRIQSEIASLQDDDKVILRMIVTGYGSAYSLVSEKLSYEASGEFARDVELLDKKGLVKLHAEEFESSFYNTEMAYSEFVALVEGAKEEDVKKANKAAAQKKAKFDEAKETGKPVELYSVFLAGNDIPKEFRDEDSDMGHLVTYAMPDGSTKTYFSHAY